MNPATTNDSPADMVDRLARTTNAHDLDGLVDCFAVDYRNETPVHPARGFTGREQVHENWSAVFAGVSDFRAELLASCRDRDVEWGEVHWHGHYGDGSPFAMRGVIIATIRDEQIAAARLYVEPVAGREEDIEEAVEHLYRPPRDDT